MMLSQTNLLFIYRSIKQFKYWIMALLVVSIVFAVNLSFRPYLLKIMVDRTSDIETGIIVLLAPAVLYIFMSVVELVVSRLHDFIWLKLKPILQKYIGVKLMERMISHSANLYQDHFAGGLVNKISDVIGGIPEIIRIFINELFGNTLVLLIASYTLYSANPKFAIAFILWASIFIVVSFKLSTIGGNLAKNTSEIKSKLIGYKVDTLSNISTIRLFTGKEKEKQELIAFFDKLVLAMQKRDWFFLKISLFQGGSFVLYQGICILWLVTDIKNKIISSGDFVLVLSINIALIKILWDFSHYIHNLAETTGNVGQGLNIVLAPIQVQDKEGANALKIISGEIIFDTVKFQYKNSAPIFNNLSIKIPSHQKVGLVGYSGSGKSTFINLILRLYEVNGGRILIDGQNIAEVTQDSLRKEIGVIPQDPILFHRSIKENISYGRIGATEEDIISAAKKAHAHQFITELSEGYNSLVGERGVKLSGGQRQRIAIARAFLKNPLILVLDEPTSQLDTITESLIQDSLLELMNNKTTFIIAHRLSTLLHMDRILVFDGGKIIEDGTHQNLLKTKGLYKNMWNGQVGSFLPKNI